MMSFTLLRGVYRQNMPSLRRYFYYEFTPKEKLSNEKTTHSKCKEFTPNNTSVANSVKQKYIVFRDEDSSEIFDIDEERQRYHFRDKLPLDILDEYHGLNLKRGVKGVFDIEDLVEVLHKENVDDIFVCMVPEELKYVDYVVVCSGRSYRHMLATAEFVRKIFKIKRRKADIIPRIEGKNSREWMALDLGNIALHIFSSPTREIYDLESLWAIGCKYDIESHTHEYL